MSAYLPRLQIRVVIKYKCITECCKGPGTRKQSVR